MNKYEQRSTYTHQSLTKKSKNKSYLGFHIPIALQQCPDLLTQFCILPKTTFPLHPAPQIDAKVHSHPPQLCDIQAIRPMVARTMVYHYLLATKIGRLVFSMCIRWNGVVGQSGNFKLFIRRYSNPKGYCNDDHTSTSVTVVVEVSCNVVKVVASTFDVNDFSTSLLFEMNVWFCWS